VSVVHIAEPEAWEAARDTGTYRADSLATEGFIHFSTWSQLPGTIERHYAGLDDLVVLLVDPEGLAVRVENGFPHLYEELPVSAVAEVLPLPDALDRVRAG